MDHPQMAGVAFSSGLLFVLIFRSISLPPSFPPRTRVRRVLQRVLVRRSGKSNRR
jgi:hypothetical protein